MCLPLKTKEVSQPGSKPKSDPTTLKFRMGQELDSVAPFPYSLTVLQRRKVPKAELGRQVSRTFLLLDAFSYAKSKYSWIEHLDSGNFQPGKKVMGQGKESRMLDKKFWKETCPPGWSFLI